MTDHDTWTLVNTVCDAHRLGQYNSVCAISNGYLGIKGNLQEDRDGYSPVLLINGVYDELDMFGQIRASNHDRRWLDPHHFDTAGRSPAVANLPDPLHTRIFVGDREVTLSRGEVLGFEQRLDLAAGVYSYRFDYRDAAGRTTRVEMTRFASIRHAHRVFMRYTITPLDHDASIRILAGISAAVFSNTTRERQFRVTRLDAAADGTCLLDACTPARGIDVQLRVATTSVGPAAPARVRGEIAHQAAYVAFEFAGARGRPIILERAVVVGCAEDGRHGVAVDADAELAAAGEQGFAAALEEQRTHWRQLWDRGDVTIEGDDRAQRYLRFSLYHLLAAAPRFTDRLSVPVKLLSGEYYQGNTFYDTDLYIVPFYTFTIPELARTCLAFRCEGLARGREIARQMGYAGAKLAWQAGPYGEECLGPWYRFVHTNIHINADVAYSLVQYWLATGDDAFMAVRGLELLVESARFYVSRATHDLRGDVYHLINVSGPDEGHCESTDNFYTNYLVSRTLSWAADFAEQFAGQKEAAALLEQLGVTEAERRHWRHVAERLPLRFDPTTGVHEQFDGFHRLPPPPPDLLTNRKDWFVPLARYQAMNQPDVVMAMVLFRERFRREVQRANWEFYKDKSLNFSSMSFALNAIMAAEMDELERAYREFLVCAGSDVDEELTGRRDTFAGLHGTAMGGTWMAAVFGFGGVSLSEMGLRITPKLPRQWRALRFVLSLRGRAVRVDIGQRQVSLEVQGRGILDMSVAVCGRPVQLQGGTTLTVEYA